MPLIIDAAINCINSGAIIEALIWQLSVIKSLVQIAIIGDLFQKCISKVPLKKIWKILVQKKTTDEWQCKDRAVIRQKKTR